MRTQRAVVPECLNRGSSDFEFEIFYRALNQIKRHWIPDRTTRGGRRCETGSAQRHTGMTDFKDFLDSTTAQLLLSRPCRCRGLWPQFSAMRSEQILQRRRPRILRSPEAAPPASGCSAKSSTFYIKYMGKSVFEFTCVFMKAAI